MGVQERWAFELVAGHLLIERGNHTTLTDHQLYLKKRRRI